MKGEMGVEKYMSNRLRYALDGGGGGKPTRKREEGERKREEQEEQFICCNVLCGLIVSPC